MKLITLSSIFFLLILWNQNVVIAGETTPAEANRLLGNSEYEAASLLLDDLIKKYTSEGRPDSLVEILYYYGKAELGLHGKDTASSSVEEFSERILALNPTPKTIRQLHLEKSAFYEITGNIQKAYDLNMTALELTEKMPEATGEEFGMIHSNLGALAQSRGDLLGALDHHRKALSFYNQYIETKPERIYITYNSLGGMMWYTSKMDSALIFYNKADSILPLLDSTAINRFYRPAFVNNNIAAIYSIQGEMEKAMKAMETTIDCLNNFIRSNDTQNKRGAAREFLFQAIENYGGLYKDMGNLGKAMELLKYAYEQKRRFLHEDSPEIAKSLILQGQLFAALHENEMAEKYLVEGLKRFEKSETDFIYWKADANYYLASVKDELGKIEEAAQFYELSEDYYKQALGNYYDELYLDFIIHASDFYARRGYEDKALKMGYSALEYIQKNQGEKTFLEYLQALNLADIHFKLEQYEKALDKSREALSMLNDDAFRKKSRLNILQVEANKPPAVLLKVKSEYELSQARDSLFLSEKLQEINKAIKIIEERKPFIGGEEGLNILLQDNRELFEWAKKLALELYEKTGAKNYLYEILSYHEAALYNRIRSRLRSEQLSVNHIPDRILQRENKLIQDLSKTSNSLDDNLSTAFEELSDWNLFLDTLRQNYPEYYRAKYTAIKEPVKDLKYLLPDNYTALRYIFIGDDLFVFVLSREEESLIKLPYISRGDFIAQLGNSGFSAFSEELYRLYRELWQPVERKINTQNLIIIPDGELFNLSFEVLTDSLCTDYTSLSNHCLLSRYSISYNYSLLLLNQKKDTISGKDNLVAFAPEFNDSMKDRYKQINHDSIKLDISYLQLLRQPFTLDLAKSASQFLKGKAFFEDESTKQKFVNTAGNTKIIHVGSHAEADNVQPELSRIIFAKNTVDTAFLEDNSLYAHQIYSHNLSSEMAVLTACETGKPVYQAGEGMISLAHAFNYAGSKSLLTSLWEVDEQSSAQIVGLFYSYLKDGLPKDESLRRAKLEYLKNASGRMIEPQYWAGLVLMGDPNPIQFDTNSKQAIWKYILFALPVLIVLTFLFRSRTIKPQK